MAIVNKKEFVEHYLDDTLRHAVPSITRVWYTQTIPPKEHPTWKNEIVIIHYASGEEQEINVNSDSNIQIVYDVLEAIRRRVL